MYEQQKDFKKASDAYRKGGALIQKEYQSFTNRMYLRLKRDVTDVIGPPKTSKVR